MRVPPRVSESTEVEWTTGAGESQCQVRFVIDIRVRRPTFAISRVSFRCDASPAGTEEGHRMDTYSIFLIAKANWLTPQG
jgi:hypothetical protein